MLTNEQAERYKREGYLSGLRIAPPPDAARYQAEFDRIEKAEGREKCQIGILDRHFDEPFIWELAAHPRVLDCVEALIGRDILLMATHAFCKYGDPNASSFVAWHQDVTYWGLEPPSALTAWYAIDDSGVENGCMRAVPRSHLNGVLEHGVSKEKGNLLSVNQEVALSKEEERGAVDFVLKAGEISLHDGRLVHGSRPNRSNRRRCGMTLRYISPDVRQTIRNSHGRGWKVVLVRGEDRYGHWDLQDAPFS